MNEFERSINDYKREISDSLYNGMRKLHAISAYLESFFWGTGRKYSCGRMKLTKLLTVFFLCDIKNNLDLVRDYILYHGNGMVTLDFLILWPLDVYEIDGDFICDKREITEEIGGDFLTSHEKLNFMRCREDCDSLTEHDKKLLEKIFRKFGAYDTKAMYEAGFKALFEIVPFKLSYDHGGVYHVDLDIDEFMRFLENNKFKYQDNEILNFIKDHYGIISEKQIQLQREKNELIDSCGDYFAEDKLLKRDFQETAERTLNSHNNERVTGLVNMVQEIEKLAHLENMTLDDVVNLSKKTNYSRKRIK